MASVVPANTAMESRVGSDDDDVAEDSSEQQRKFLKTFTVGVRHVRAATSASL